MLNYKKPQWESDFRKASFQHTTEAVCFQGKTVRAKLKRKLIVAWSEGNDVAQMRELDFMHYGA